MGKDSEAEGEGPRPRRLLEGFGHALYLHLDGEQDDFQAKLELVHQETGASVLALSGSSAREGEGLVVTLQASEEDFWKLLRQVLDSFQPTEE